MSTDLHSPPFLFNALPVTIFSARLTSVDFTKRHRNCFTWKSICGRRLVLMMHNLPLATVAPTMSTLIKIHRQHTYMNMAVILVHNPHLKLYRPRPPPTCMSFFSHLKMFGYTTGDFFSFQNTKRSKIGSKFVYNGVCRLWQLSEKHPEQHNKEPTMYLFAFSQIGTFKY